LRFDYNPPSPLEIIADGQSVAIRDKRLNTQDIYNLSQTPLKFLLNARVDLARETRILNVSPSEEMLKVSLEDKSTLGGTSQITLFYDAKTQNLSRWEVIDPQGLETSVAIYNLNKTRVPDPSRFRINQERILEDRR
jgi:outer membrane lipoprotein-sorting protein